MQFERYKNLLLSLVLVALPAACDEQSDDDTENTGNSGNVEGSAGEQPDGGGGEGGEVADDEGASDEPDNVAACESLIDELECGGMDFSTFLDCSAYANTPCDIADYLNCLEDNFSCNEGVFDASGWMSCTALATC